MSPTTFGADRLTLTIIDVTASGLTLNDGGNDWVESWGAISDILAARIPDGSATTLILALGIRNERTVLAAEFDPIWNALGKAIHDQFPETQPPSVWQAQLAELGKLRIYGSASILKD